MITGKQLREARYKKNFSAEKVAKSVLVVGMRGASDNARDDHLRD